MEHSGRVRRTWLRLLRLSSVPGWVVQTLQPSCLGLRLECIFLFKFYLGDLICDRYSILCMNSNHGKLCWSHLLLICTPHDLKAFLCFLEPVFYFLSICSTFEDCAIAILEFLLQPHLSYWLLVYHWCRRRKCFFVVDHLFLLILCMRHPGHHVSHEFSLLCHQLLLLL